MGIIFGSLYLIGIGFYLLYYKSIRTKFGIPASLFFTLLATLPFTYDIVIANIFGAYYCLIAPPHPKTKIEKKVEYPISIYWEDNVYHGFSKIDRERMIRNYLDGIHLKTMALNGDDGKIYVYHLEEPILNEIKNEFSKQEYYKSGIKKYIQIVMKTEKTYTKATMPKTNYTVTFNEVKLNSLVRKFLYADETKVIENKITKVIAYNRRYMRFYYNILPDFAGGRYYWQEPICGDWYEIHLKVFKMLEWRLDGLGEHELDLNKYLYMTRRK